MSAFSHSQRKKDKNEIMVETWIMLLSRQGNVCLLTLTEKERIKYIMVETWIMLLSRQGYVCLLTLTEKERQKCNCG